MKRAVSVFCFLFLTIAGGCSRQETAPGQASAEAQAAGSANSAGNEYVATDAKGIQTITVKTSSIPEYLELPAHIEADPTRVVHVFPPAGGRIVEMKVRPSDRVEKGQLLALLESNDVSRAVADYHKAKVDAEVKQRAYTRAQDLLAHHAIAEKDLQQAEGDAQMAQAEMAATAQQIRVYGLDPEHATTELRVVAPRSGVVLDIGAASGEYSKSLDAPQPLCTIADISSVWALGDIYERDFASLKMGEQAQVSLDAYPNQKWPGRVGVLSDAVDPTTRTLHLRVVLSESRWAHKARHVRLHTRFALLVARNRGSGLCGNQGRERRAYLRGQRFRPLRTPRRKVGPRIRQFAGNPLGSKSR